MSDPLGESQQVAQADVQYGQKLPEFQHPLSPEIYNWLQSVTKATKAIRVYERNNQMFHQFVDKAYTQLRAILQKTPALTLNVREDRLLFEKDPVHINSDRQEGMPFILYRNALRRLTFEQGMTSDELTEFMGAIMTDFTSFDYVGEDLVTVLWRLSLPHLRYFAIDALSMSVDPNTDAGRREQNDIDRLQTDIDDLVAAIYNASSLDDEFVKGASITKGDLEALKDIREEKAEDLDLLDVATARAVAALPPEEIERLAASVKADDDAVLLGRLMEHLIDVLYKERGQGFGQTIELVQQLFDSVLLAGRFGWASDLVKRLRRSEREAERLEHVHVSQHLLRVFSKESRIAPVLSSLGEKTIPADIAELFRAMGNYIAPTLLVLLDSVSAPPARKQLIELIGEVGLPDAKVIQRKMKDAKPFVMLDLLQLASKLTQKDLAPVLLAALEAPHPKVRASAVSMLRTYPKGTADDLLVTALNDPELEVRLAACRVAAQRRSQTVKSTIKVMLLADDLLQRESRELRTLMAAYAAIAGDQAVAVLSKILNPGFFARSRNSEAQIAAAFALSQVANDEAVASIQKGARTINARVREACRRALTKEAKAANEAMFLGGNVDDLLADFVGIEAREDPLKAALEAKKQQRLAGGEEPAAEEVAEFGPPPPAPPPSEELAYPGIAEVRTPHRTAEALPDNFSFAGAASSPSVDEGSLHAQEVEVEAAPDPAAFVAPAAATPSAAPAPTVATMAQPAPPAAAPPVANAWPPKPTAWPPPRAVEPASELAPPPPPPAAPAPGLADDLTGWPAPAPMPAPPHATAAAPAPAWPTLPQAHAQAAPPAWSGAETPAGNAWLAAASTPLPPTVSSAQVTAPPWPPAPSPQNAAAPTAAWPPPRTASGVANAWPPMAPGGAGRPAQPPPQAQPQMEFQPQWPQPQVPAWPPPQQPGNWPPPQAHLQPPIAAPPTQRWSHPPGAPPQAAWPPRATPTVPAAAPTAQWPGPPRPGQPAAPAWPPQPAPPAPGRPAAQTPAPPPPPPGGGKKDR